MYLDSIGRQISKRTPNMRSLVMQGYNTEKNRIIPSCPAITRKLSSVAEPAVPIDCSAGRTPTSASSPSWPRRSSRPTSHRLQPQAHRLQLEAHRRLQLLTHPRRCQRHRFPRVRASRARLAAEPRRRVHHQPADRDDHQRRRAAGRHARRGHGLAARRR